MSHKKKRKRTQGDVVLDMRELDVARAHDGFMRGAPEPVVMVAVIALEGEARVVARALWRFRRPSEPPPTSVAAWKPARPVEQRYAIDDDARVLLLAIGMEEDGGDDVSRVYAALERASTMTLWRVDAGSIPAPLPLIASADQLTSPARVRVLVDDVDIGVRLKPTDDFVGACAVAVPRVRLLADHRLHLADDLGANDWTAVLKVRTT